MKHFRVFDTESEFATKSSTIPTPWVVYVEESKKVYYSIVKNFVIDESVLDENKVY